MTDTDPKMKAFTESAERRISDLQRQTREDFRELKSLVKDTHAKVDNTMLEVVAIKTQINSLATQKQLLETMGTVRDFCVEKIKDNMDEHLVSKHPRSNDSRGWGPKQIAALVGAIVALSGALAAVVQAVIR